jgi:small-conductance mechanosensitive channel
MTNKATPNVGEVAENVSGQSVALFADVMEWISGNFIGVLIAAGLGTLIALILIGVRSLGCRLLGHNDGGEVKWRTIFARVLSKTSLFFIIICSTALVAEHANTPPGLLGVIEFLFVIASAFQAAIWGRELILGFVEHRVGPEAQHSTLGSAIGIIRLLVSVALFAIALVVILDNLGVNVTGLVAGLGIGGIAIGLAAQGIFSDLFAALSIIFDKPFRRGDGIRFDTVSGSVEAIGLKTTRIRSLSGEEIVVSNAKLLEQQLHNFANLDHRRWVVPFGITYQTPPEVCGRIPDMAREIVEAHKDTVFVRCGMIAFGASSLDYELIFDVHSTDFEYAYNTRSQICIELLDAFNKAKIDFAYPTQTSFTAAPDGHLVMPYPDVRLVATEDLDGSDGSTPAEKADA